MIEPIQTWRYFWEATMPDGTVVSQFDAEGRLIHWRDLPDKALSVVLKPFSEDQARRAQEGSQVAAVPTSLKPVRVENVCGAGLWVKRDCRFHVTPYVKCSKCGHTWNWSPTTKAKCPECGTVDDWFCVECQSLKSQVLKDDKGRILCPECRARGKTRGLKRIQKFTIHQSTQYETHYVIDALPFLEIRVTDEGITVSQK